MKNGLLKVVSVFACVSLADGCKHEVDPAPPCPNAGAFVRREEQILGTVYYDRSRGSYGVQVATSMDSADMGLSCNLPSKYQKELTKVRFTGSYYEYDKSVTGPVGYRYYYLTIESISSQ